LQAIFNKVGQIVREKGQPLASELFVKRKKLRLLKNTRFRKRQIIIENTEKLKIG